MIARAHYTHAPVEAAALKNVYIVEEFRMEILCGKRCRAWVLNRIASREIKTVASRPFLIPQSEAARFINPTK